MTKNKYSYFSGVDWKTGNITSLYKESGSVYRFQGLGIEVYIRSRKIGKGNPITNSLGFKVLKIKG